MSLRSRSTVSYLAMAALLIALALTAISGCGGGGSSSSSGQTTAPSIASGSFKAAASTITAGGSTTLSWSVSNATSLSIDNGVGTVTGASVTVKPSATTTYTLTATNSAGTSVTAQVTVTVVAAPSIASFTATPSLLNPVTLGTTTATLSWSTADATTVSIDNSVGTETGSSVTVTPSATTTYTLTATNAAGTSVTATTTVGVRNKLALLAGNLFPGFDADGTGKAARFNEPEGIAVDANGNLYVTDTENCEIRKVTPEGVVTTIASGTASTTSGDAVQVRSSRARTVEALSRLKGNTKSIRAARQVLQRELRNEARSFHPESSDSLIEHAGLEFPRGIAVSGDGGTIYVADTGNVIIRKIVIASDGTATMSTFAGTAGSYGTADGTGSAASFWSPEGITLDTSGNLYVTDSNTIRKITAAGVVTTLTVSGSGGSINGTGTAAIFNWLQGIAVDASGNLYVADTGSGTICKITSAGVVTTLAGTTGTSGYTDGTGTAARFNWPEGIAVDASGNLYVADMENDTIRKITSAGIVTTLAGTTGTSGYTDGTGTAARFNWPKGIAVDASGNPYVADMLNNTIRKITSAGVVTTLAGIPTTVGSADGTGTNAYFDRPEKIAVDADGNLYVADSYNNTIRKITAEGVVSTIAGKTGTQGSADGTGTAARFNDPEGIAVDASGNLYVADTGNCTIRKITAEGVVTTLAGSSLSSSGSADGTGIAALFNYPTGIAVDASGNLYVADTENDTIRKITPEGVVTTLAGKAGIYGSAEGTGTTARFSNPEGIAIDASGNLYVTDTENSTIREITSEGVVTTLAGTARTYGYADGTGTAAIFYSPRGIAVDASGNLYVADQGNNVIRKITSAGVVTTIIGVPSAPESSTGLLPASIYSPDGVTVDSTGNLFITVPDAVLTLEP